MVAKDSMLTLLEAENSRLGPDLVGPDPKKTPGTPLADFFARLIHERSPRTKDELRQAALAAGYFADGESAGRATHTTLYNIAKSGRIRDLGDGKYGEPQVLPARAGVGAGLE